MHSTAVLIVVLVRTIRPDSPLMLCMLLTPFMKFMTVMNRLTVVHDASELHAFHDKLGMHATLRTRITQVIRPPVGHQCQLGH